MQKMLHVLDFELIPEVNLNFLQDYFKKSTSNNRDSFVWIRYIMYVFLLISGSQKWRQTRLLK